MRCLIIAPLLVCLTLSLHSQNVLDKQLSVEFRQERLDKVLESLSRTGHFYFSYSSELLKRDSLVSLSAQSRSVRQILDLLFQGNVEYKADGNYIILRKPPPKINEPTNTADPQEKRYIVSGVIVDENTGEAVRKASVYDKNGLTATLTNEDGFFTVRLKSKPGPALLTVSKEFYDDTTVRIAPGADQKITILISQPSASRKTVTISPDDGYLTSDPIRVEPRDLAKHEQRDPIRVETTSWGRLLLSSRLKIQSINLRKFFIQEPFQLSLLPAIGTQGPLSPQITNKISLNMIGGYAAGLRGIELGGVFNIEKKDVRGLQAAGVLNVVGGSVRGVQLAGLHNTVLDSMKGLQAAGVLNKAGQVHGIQLSGLVNITKKLKGVQIGIINIADSSYGVSIGVINLSKNGLKEFSFFADEVAPMNIAFRSGSNKLYSILLIGYNPFEAHRSYRYGFGLGHRFILGKKLSLDPELTNEHLAPGSRDNFKYSNDLYKLNLDLHARLGRHFSIAAGPSLSFYNADKTMPAGDHVFSPLYDGYPTWSVSDSFTGWIGGRLSLHFFF